MVAVAFFFTVVFCFFIEILPSKEMRLVCSAQFSIFTYGQIEYEEVRVGLTSSVASKRNYHQQIAKRSD